MCRKSTIAQIEEGNLQFPRNIRTVKLRSIILIKDIKYSTLFKLSENSIRDYVLTEYSYVQTGACWQTCAPNGFTTCYIKRGIYRRHVVRYKFSLSRVPSNELAVVAKFRQKVRSVAGGKRLNSQILPRGFSRKRCVGEKERENLVRKIESIYAALQIRQGCANSVNPTMNFISKISLEK